MEYVYVDQTVVNNNEIIFDLDEERREFFPFNKTGLHIM